MSKPWILKQLEGKAPSSHTHSASDVSGLEEAITGVVKEETFAEHVNDTNIHFGLSATANADGTLYRGTTAPTGTTKLNYSGYFQATRVLGAYFSDYAECFNVVGDIRPGQAVIISGENEYRAADKANSTAVIGIVSDEYYMCIGQQDDSTNVPVALCGKVHALIEGECKPGDFMVCAGTDGKLKAYTGSRRPAFGSVIAQALSNRDPETDKALVMVLRR